MIQFEGAARAHSKHNLSNSLIAQNSEPIVKWSTVQPVERPLSITLEALITPATHPIMKACVTTQDANGQIIEAVKFPLTTPPLILTECKNFGTGPEGWSVPGTSTPRVVSIPIDTFFGWPTNAVTLTLTATDAAAQEHKATFTIPADNHKRILTPEGIETGVFGWTNIGISETNRTGSPTLYGTYKNLCVQTFKSEMCTKTGDYGYQFKDYRLMTSINTACFPNGVHTVTMIGVSHRDEAITETYSLTTVNPKPKFNRIEIVNRKSRWNNKTVSTSFNISALNSCDYSVRLTGGATSRTFKGVLSDDEFMVNEGIATISLTKLKPRTKYTAKVTISSPQGKRTSTKTFTTPSIPSRPSGGGGNGGGNSGGGSGGISFVGWNLAEVRNVVGYAYSARQASSCSQYGMENGLLGIQNESNWTVVGQSGSTLYVCKR